MKFLSGNAGVLFFTRLRRFFLGAAGASVEVFSSSSATATFFLRRRFLGAAAVPADFEAPFVFFQDAEARLRDSLKLVEPAA